MFSALPEAIQEFLDSSDDFNPVITPVLDMSDIESGSKGISRILGTSKLDVRGSTAMAARSIPISGTSANGETATQTPSQTNYTFNQYNTSPKALSQYDIYRQTKNQFAMLKERGK